MNFLPKIRNQVAVHVQSGDRSDRGGHGRGGAIPNLSTEQSSRDRHLHGGQILAIAVRVLGAHADGAQRRGELLQRAPRDGGDLRKHFHHYPNLHQ